MDEVIARAKKLINRALKKDSWDFTGLTKSKLVDTRNLLDRLLESASPRNDWTRLFCRQLGRLMNYYKSFPNDFWVQLHDDLLYILDGSNGEQNKSNSWTRFLERMKLETELEQRELHFQQTFGERKSLNELFCEHTEFLEEYLQKCISLHSKLQIRGFWENLDDFLCKNYGLTEAMLTSESRKRLEEKLKCVEITLDCSNRSLTEFDLPFSKYDKSYTTTDESLRNFLPSTEPPLPLEKNHNQESTKSKRWFVILGDPGSAKTSFLRWIMRTFAEAAHRGDDIIVLGRYDYLPVRIPILIRIGEFAAWLDQHQTKALIDYIGEHTWFTERYCRNDNKNVLKELIYHGHALILLDGLDEIPDMGRRGQIVDHVRKFIDEYVRAPNFISAFDSATFDVRRLYTSNEKLFGIPPPCKSSGNQIIVTSRIVGYKLYPIAGPSIQHSSLLLMNHQEAKQFVNDWMLQVEKAVVEVLLNEGFKPDEETMTVSSQKRSNIIKMMFENSSHLIMSSPSLLSLICTFFFQSSVEFCPKSRIEVYDHAVQSTLYSWRNQQSNMSESVLTNFLIDLATYLHLQSPSGLIDAFDMEQLCCSSLRQQNVSDNRVQLREYARKLISLLDTNVTIVTERGLLVFGFLHLSFQEYFAARRLVRGSSIDEIAKRILTYTINPRFRESILLALSWISWKWSLDNYDKFCNLLVTPTIDFAIPLGALLFFDAFNDLLRLPSNSVIFIALNTLLDHPSHIITKTYLKSNLLKLHEDIITEWMQSYLKDKKRLSKFCKCFLSEISKSNDESDWSNYELLPSVIYQQLQLFHNMNTSTAFIIDQTLRRTVTPGYKPDDIYKNELSSYFKKHNICTSNIHPAILSVIIAVCNGINIEIRRKPSLKELEDMGQIPDENAEDSIKMDFSFKKMYRESSILLQIIEYFANDKEPHSVKIQTLIRNYENILQSSSSADTSLNIVDTFIALICLQGLSDLSMYEKYDGYQALPIALDRLKWVWYYCNSMFSVSDQALEIFLASEVNSIKSVLFAQHNSFDEQSMAFSLLCTIAWNKLDNISSSYQSNFNIDRNNNIEQSSECQPEFVHSVKWINLCKMTQNSYPFQNLQQKSFLLFTFVPQSLQKLYYRLIISPTSNIDSLPLVVFLSQCLILFEDVTQNDWNFYLALSMLQPLFKVYMLEHYISVLFWKNTSTRGYRKDNRKEFLNAMKDQMSFNGSVIDEQQDWEIFINVERQRIVEAINATQNQETDERLFAASISLARLFQARYHSCKYRTANDISLSSPESKEIHLVIINILDPLLRIIAQSMILDMKNPFIFDEEQRYQLQWEMINLLQSLLPHLSLLKSVLLFIRCYPVYQIFPIHFQHMANAIGEKLNETSLEKQTEDQEAAFIALRQLSNSHLSHYLSKFAKHTKSLSNLLQFNSTVFFRYFNNIESFESSNTILLSLMYLTELIFDAQILKIYTNDHQKNQTSSWKEFKQLWDNSSKGKKILTFQVATWITNYLQISTKEELHDIIGHVSSCLIIDRKTLPVIEKWCKYRMDTELQFFAQYATLQLVKEGLNIPDSLDIIKDILDNDCGFRLKSIVECLFSSQFTSSTMMRHILIVLHKQNRYSFQISIIIHHKEVLELILKLELERVISNVHVLSNITTKSFVSMIGGCSKDLLCHLAEYLHQFSNINNEFEHMIKEEYLAVIIRWIIETYNWNNSQEDLWIELYTYIFTFLHNHRFPQVQKAIFYALNYLWMDERHVLLREDIFINLKKVICSWTTYPEDVISICLLTFGSCLLTLKKLELSTPISNKLQSTLTILFQKSSSKVISIRAGFCLIFIQQLKITSGTILKWFSNKGDLISKERYNILLQQALYRKMDISYACTDAIVQYIHHDGLVDTFILDLYNYLCNKRRNNSNLFDFEPEYVFIAWQLINDNIDTFHRAVQKSSFGEQELKTELYFYFCYTNIGYDRIITIQIYASFGVLTIELVDMLKWTDDRFDVDDLWKYLKCIKQVYDRSAVEQLFEVLDLMAYNTKFIRFSYILKLIIQLVEVHAISLLEVQQRVALVITKLSYENNWIEWQHEKHILDTLMNLTCIKSKLASNTNTEFFTEDNIEKDFEGELQNFDKKSAMFLRRNYFLTIFSSLSNI